MTRSRPARIGRPLACLGAAAWLSLSGCATSTSQGAGDVPAPPASGPVAEGPAAHPGQGAERQAKPPPEHDRLFRGVVKETMNSGGYTYMNVELSTGETRWTAADQTEVAAGDRVTLRISMHLSDFRSKSLERTFPSIYFVYVEQVESAAAPYQGTI